MGFDGAGTFEITTPGQPASPHTVISSTNFNSLMQDLATGISTAICRDGQSTITANLPMNAKKLTGLAAGTARTDSANVSNIQDGTGIYVATVGGTADSITLSPSPAITAYAAGQTFRFIATGANTGAVAVVVSGLSGPKAVTKNGTTALVAGDIPAGMMVEITYDGTRFILGTSGGSTYLPLTGGSLSGALSITGNISMTGHALFTDATYDIGASGATRPRDLYLSRAAYVGENLSVTGNLAGHAALGGYLFGCTLSNSGSDAVNDIVVDPGCAVSNESDPLTRNTMFLLSALTKQLDAAWSVGTNAGMLDTGSIADTTYHIYLIMRGDTGVVDVLASTSATSPTMPTNYTRKRRIGSIIRSGGTILAFVQDGDEFLLSTPVLDVNATNPGTSAVLAALTVPAGIKVKASANVFYNSSTDATMDYLYLSDPATSDQTGSNTAAPLAQFKSNNGVSGIGEVVVGTNTSAQIRYRTNVSDAGTTVRIATRGWLDTRGKHA